MQTPHDMTIGGEGLMPGRISRSVPLRGEHAPHRTLSGSHSCESLATGQRCLECSRCRRCFVQDPGSYRLFCDHCGQDSLLVSRSERPPRLPVTVSKLIDWSDWLSFSPFCPQHDSQCGLLDATALGHALGIRRLRLLISGYAPQFGASILSASFKEYEAIGTLSRIRSLLGPLPVIASAGNSALAALELGNRYQIPAVLVVPDCVPMMLSLPPGPLTPMVISLRGGSYADAKRVVSRLSEHSSGLLQADGGFRNVARREALALPFLQAVFQLQRLPQIYVQAVGSGCGPLGVLEASHCLIANGYANALPQFLLVQNAPYAPIADTFAAGLASIPVMTEAHRLLRIRSMDAKVLSSSDIPYGLPGGVYDALRLTGGLALSVTNDQIAVARRQLLELLGLDVCPASGAAFAGLTKAISAGRIDPDAEILVHLTGVGRDRLLEDGRLLPYPPDLETVVSDSDGIAASALRYVHRVLA
jgi:cysteate synthase